MEHTTDLCVNTPSCQFLGLLLLSNTIWHSWSLLSFEALPSPVFSVAFITIWFCWLFILANETVSFFSKDLVYSCHCLEQCLIQNRCLISICWMNDCELKSSYILVRSFPSPFLVRLFLQTSHFLIVFSVISTPFISFSGWTTTIVLTCLWALMFTEHSFISGIIDADGLWIWVEWH